jgi:hypothetical protein
MPSAAAPPNPSLERRPSEAGHLGPGRASLLHCRSPGQGGLPLRAPQLER